MSDDPVTQARDLATFTTLMDTHAAHPIMAVRGFDAVHRMTRRITLTAAQAQGLIDTISRALDHHPDRGPVVSEGLRALAQVHRRTTDPDASGRVAWSTLVRDTFGTDRDAPRWPAQDGRALSGRMHLARALATRESGRMMLIRQGTYGRMAETGTTLPEAFRSPDFLRLMQQAIEDPVLAEEFVASGLATTAQHAVASAAVSVEFASAIERLGGLPSQPLPAAHFAVARSVVHGTGALHRTWALGGQAVLQDRDSAGRTALEYAVSLGHGDAVEALGALGAPGRAKDIASTDMAERWRTGRKRLHAAVRRVSKPIQDVTPLDDNSASLISVFAGTTG